MHNIIDFERTIDRSFVDFFFHGWFLLKYTFFYGQIRVTWNCLLALKISIKSVWLFRLFANDRN